MDALATLGLGVVVSWSALPVLVAVALAGQRSLRSRERALGVALVLGAALIATPLLRVLAAPNYGTVVGALPSAWEGVALSVVEPEAAFLAARSVPPLAWVGALWSVLALVGLGQLAAQVIRWRIAVRRSAAPPGGGHRARPAHCRAALWPARTGRAGRAPARGSRRAPRRWSVAARCLIARGARPRPRRRPACGRAQTRVSGLDSHDAGA